VIICLGALVAPATLFSAAINFTNAPVAHDRQLTLGFVFTTNSDIEISTLGYYDEGQDGFLANHEVGIYDSNGQLLTSIVLNAGSGSYLDGLYRYRAITPITLLAERTFTIAATSGGFADGFAYGTSATISNFVVDPNITVAADASRFLYQDYDILRMPVDAFGHTIYGSEL